jgi:hypothetical protein
MATTQVVKVNAGSGSDEAAKWITSELFRFVGPVSDTPETVVEMYEWVRQSNFHRDEQVRMSDLARMWDEYRREQRQSDWLMRAFGD